MKTKNRSNWLWPLLALLVAGGVAGWLLHRNKTAGGNDVKDLLSKAGHEAKQSAVKMTMKAASMSITSIENNHINVLNKVVVNNPLPAPLTINRIDYSVTADGIKVAEGAYTTPVRIGSLSDTTLSLPMHVLVTQMDKVNNAAAAAGRDSARYVFHNIIHTNLPVAGNTRIPFDVKEQLPVIWTPKVKPGDVDLNNFGLKNSGMGMTLMVKNPNSFTIRMLNGRYTMAIDGQQTMKGNMEKVVVLPPKQTVPVQLHADAKTGRALKTGWKMLFNKKDSRYRITFNSDIASDRKLLQNSSMQFTDEGSLKDLMEAVKKSDE